LRWVIACVLTAACSSNERAAVPGADASVAQDAGSDTRQLVHLLAVSPTHSCAIRKAGVFCWGENFVGQLGNGETTMSDAAVEAKLVGKGAVEIAAATGRTCIRTDKGTIECWGANGSGQSGDGTNTDTLKPVAAMGIDDAIQLALDDGSTCVIRKAGRTVSCWGGGRDEAWLPRKVEGLTNIQELRAGTTGNYCARDAKSAVWCWRVGDTDDPAPQRVEALAGAKAVAVAGFDETCALVEAGNIVCHSSESDVSVALDDSDDVVTINAAGSLAVCAKKRDGSWYCWNVLRQMLEAVGSPAIKVPSEMVLTDLVLSGFRLCAQRQDRQVVCANANEVLVGLNSIEASALKVVQGLPD
jgi:alpha-tubulin suppressor-like RCC1 family protein